MIINHSTISNIDVNMVKILITSIPRNLKPKLGTPTIHLTNSLFHSFCLMYSKYPTTGDKSEEEFFDFCRKQKVWAFSCMPTKDSGDVYLALKERKNRDISFFSIEHTIFHEIGHLFHYGNGINIYGSMDVEHEALSDIYANACMINLFNKTKTNGMLSKFSEKSMKILKEIKIKESDKLLCLAETIYRKYGVL